MQEQERHFLALVRKGHSKEISKTRAATAIDATVNKVVINSRYQRGKAGELRTGRHTTGRIKACLFHKRARGKKD